MAVFRSEKYKTLIVSGAGRFTDGVLEVDGYKAERVRSLVGRPEFGVTEGEAKESEARSSDDKGDSGQFDPSEHNAKDVVEYLNGLDGSEGQAHLDEVNRVYEAEKEGDARKGVLNAIEGVTTQE